MTQRNRAFSAVVWVAIALGLTTPVMAEVSDVSKHGFTVQHRLEIAAPRAAVYQALVEDVGEWWNASHTYSGDAGNLSIDPRPGGCFCEKLPDGGGVSHMTVAFVAPEKSLRLLGGLGPLQPMGVQGGMSFTFADAEEGTRLDFMYSVGGYGSGGLDTLAPAVDGMLSEQLTRLKSYIEKKP